MGFEVGGWVEVIEIGVEVGIRVWIEFEVGVEIRVIVKGGVEFRPGVRVRGETEIWVSFSVTIRTGTQ